ncbi:unnamed protein product [Lactuca saligna]|uniref:Uncharacterized protein n=1 Tax=Lactuca saligna TaxID=75948 RepID=A0AA36EBK5_LACSI|nr:unnamed protein product [Lactuca saligna]
MRSLIQSWSIRMPSLLQNGKIFSQLIETQLKCSHLPMPKSLNNQIKVTQAFENRISEATKKVLHLQTEVKEFKVDFRTSSDKTITDMNKVIEGFRSYLKAEKEDLKTLHADIKRDNVDLNTAITHQLTKL